MNIDNFFLSFLRRVLANATLNHNVNLKVLFVENVDLPIIIGLKI